MELIGHVQNGVIVLDRGFSLPEGSVVTVWCEIAPTPPKGNRVRFPLVDSEFPGTLKLTNERIAEILDEEDVACYSEFFGNRNGAR